MSGKHTPGPFFIGAQSTEAGEPIVLICAEARDGENKTIARMVGPDAQGNARRFAASPDMLDALENALGGFNEKECNCDGEYTQDGLVGHACYFHRIEQDIRSAIAKATGGEE